MNRPRAIHRRLSTAYGIHLIEATKLLLCQSLDWSVTNEIDRFALLGSYWIQISLR